jgi:hypothetical protein
MSMEIQEQLSLKVKEHMHMKERKPSDYVKPRKSETELFEDLMRSKDNNMKKLEEDKKNFIAKRGGED